MSEDSVLKTEKQLSFHINNLSSEQIAALRRELLGKQKEVKKQERKKAEKLEPESYTKLGQAVCLAVGTAWIRIDFKKLNNFISENIDSFMDCQITGPAKKADLQIKDIEELGRNCRKVVTQRKKELNEQQKSDKPQKQKEKSKDSDKKEKDDLSKKQTKKEEHENNNPPLEEDPVLEVQEENSDNFEDFMNSDVSTPLNEEFMQT